MRWAYLTINGVVINHEEQNGLYFEAEYNSGKGNEIGSMIFKIYNLAQDVQVNSVISYNFGRDNIGGLFGTFTVKKRNVYTQGADVVQELFCSERAIESSNVVSVSLNGKIKSSQAIREICKNAKLNVVQLELKEDKEYPTSFSCFGKAVDELKKIADNCSSKVKIEDKSVYFYVEYPSQKSILDLSFETGLLENPTASEKLVLDNESEIKAQNGEVQASYNSDDKIKTKNTNEFDFSVKCLSSHLLRKGNMISIRDSKTFNGLARIHSLTMNNSEKWIANLKIKKL